MNSVASSSGRSLVASTALSAAALLALIACAWLLTSSGAHDIVWAELTVAVTVAGLVALGWLRSARVGLTAPQVMLLLGAAGFAVWSRRALASRKIHGCSIARRPIMTPAQPVCSSAL